MITWPCWLSIKSNIFLAWNLALEWEKKVKQRVWGGERAALPTLPVWHSARFSHWFFFLCCCFTSPLKPKKKGKNIQCQCIKLCLNNMLISLDIGRFAIWVQLSEASAKNGYGFYRPIGKNMGWKKVCFDLKQGQDFFPIWPWEGCPGHFHIKVMRMLVVSLWGVNYRFWSHLGCLGWKVTIFAHSGIAKKFTKNALTLTTQKSPLEVNLSLSHTHIGLP